MLRVHVNQPVTRLFQVVQVNRRVVHESTRFPAGPYFPPQDALVAIVYPVVLVKKWLQVVRRNIKNTLDHAFIRSLLDVAGIRSEEHTSELQSRPHLVCRLLLEKKK